MTQSPDPRRRDDPRMHTVEMAAVAGTEGSGLAGLEDERLTEVLRADVRAEASSPSWRAVAGMVAAGGAAGSLLRALLDALMPAITMAGFVAVPWSTLIANTLGCLAAGVLAGLVEVRRDLPWWARPLLGTGLLAGFTTTAIVILQVSTMIGAGVSMLALEIAVASAVLPLGAAVGGVVLGRSLGRERPRGRRR